MRGVGDGTHGVVLQRQLVRGVGDRTVGAADGEHSHLRRASQNITVGRFCLGQRVGAVGQFRQNGGSVRRTIFRAARNGKAQRGPVNRHRLNAR